MSKHTPGPWAIEKKSEGHSIVNRSFEGDEWCIAEVYKQTDIAIANANLIAAAPDLLEALDYALSALAHCRADKGYGSMQSRAAHLAANAIAKARGEA